MSEADVVDLVDPEVVLQILQTAAPRMGVDVPTAIVEIVNAGMTSLSITITARCKRASGRSGTIMLSRWWAPSGAGELVIQWSECHVREPRPPQARASGRWFPPTPSTVCGAATTQRDVTVTEGKRDRAAGWLYVDCLACRAYLEACDPLSDE